MSNDEWHRDREYSDRVLYKWSKEREREAAEGAAAEIERLQKRVAELEAERAVIFKCCGMVADDAAEDVVELVEDLRSDARHFERRCAELEANAIPRDELVRALRERAATYASGTTNPSPAALRSMERGAMECEHLANVIEARAFTPKDGKS